MFGCGRKLELVDARNPMIAALNVWKAPSNTSSEPVEPRSQKEGPGNLRRSGTLTSKVTKASVSTPKTSTSYPQA